MTNEHRRRIEQAIDETQRVLAKEMRYLPKFRKMDMIAEYESHIAKLVGWLETA